MRTAITLLSCLFLAACAPSGGGGSGGVTCCARAAGDAPGNDPPSVNAGLDRTVTAGATVRISGGASDYEGFVTARWRQTSGPSVDFSSRHIVLYEEATLTFVAPSVSTPTVLVFTLMATDDDGVSNSDSVAVTVLPAAEAAGLSTPPAFISRQYRFTALMDLPFADENLRRCVLETGFTHALAVTDLDCSNRSIFDAGGIENLSALTRLDLSRNQLTVIDTSLNPALTHLDLSHNHLSWLDVSRNSRLQWLNADHNPLEWLDQPQRFRTRPTVHD